MNVDRASVSSPNELAGLNISDILLYAINSDQYKIIHIT